MHKSLHYLYTSQEARLSLRDGALAAHYTKG